jgi:N,N'-diacetyllegionaminate synthase
MLDGIIKTKRHAKYIAEIGLNHNGDREVARAMISAAARAGADFVKFQAFVPELLYSIYTDDLLNSGREASGDSGRIDFFRKFVLGRKDYLELRRFADGLGVHFFSSVFDIESLRLMEDVGVPLYKIASSEVTNCTLVEAIAETGRPAVLSTGISREDEIRRAVEIFRKRSKAELILMHCVSLYPTPPEQANLARITALAAAFGLPVGFSDHTRDAAAAIVAASLGARIFEKHFTIDRFHDCPDKEISSTPEEFSGMIDSVEKAIGMIGTGAISYGDSEAGVALASRRSLFARRSIPAGKMIEEDDLISLRPGVGMPVYDIKRVVGKRSMVDIPESYLLRDEYVSSDD